MPSTDRHNIDAVTISVPSAASATRMWDALTVGRAVWWPEMTFNPVVGATVTEVWSEDGVERSAHGSVTEVDDGRVLAFEWCEPGWEAALTVRFSVDETAQGCMATVTETGFERLENGSVLRAAHRDGWNYHLSRLAQYAESDDLRSAR